jgi:hypothetical protein
MSRFLYFAYGSNMLSARLRERTPSARPLGVARLEGHVLRWHKAGRDGSGKCDIVAAATPLAHVQGVVYEVALADKPQLDAAEALGVGYAEVETVVHLAGAALRARAYAALQTDPAVLPYDWYKALVVGGACEHGLSADYVAALQAVPARPDPDADRAARHFALAAPFAAGAPFSVPGR